MKREHASKRRESIIRNYGSWEAYLAAMRDSGRKGGQNGGGQFNDPEKAKQASLKGVEARRRLRDERQGKVE